MFLRERLSHWAKETPEAAAIAFEGGTITFAALAERSEQVRHLLALRFKVKPGDRVSYLGINHPDMLVLLLACAGLGAIFNPLNSRLARAEYNYLLGDAEPVVCFFDPHFAALAAEIDAGSVRFEPLSALDDAVSGGTALADTAGNGSDALLLVYTSGTTGYPKGVVLSHDAVTATIANGQALYDFRPGQRVQITLPLFHVGGMCILLLPALTHGASIYLHARFDPVATLAEIERENIRTSIFVPAQMAAMMALEDWQTRDLSCLDFVAVGSSIIPMGQIKAFHARGVPVSQVYGATETGPTAIALTIEAAMDHEGSAGTPAPLCSIDVRKADGTPAETGERGEIWVSGPNILSGYWRNGEETAKVLVDGWYNTGDIGYRDTDGYFWIVDRSKDVIISGGENIYPAEVEAAILQHPAVAAIAVVGRPDAHWGETPVAAVELKAGASLSHEELTAFLDGRIARYKTPKALVTFDALPRNGMGKIEKPVLRQDKRILGR